MGQASADCLGEAAAAGDGLGNAEASSYFGLGEAGIAATHSQGAPWNA
jgi:hypothetical protein